MLSEITDGIPEKKNKTNNASPIFPRELKQMGSQTLGIVWSDGHNALYSVRQLRLLCPCALCVDEHTLEKKITDAQIPDTILPRMIEPIGRYALKITWNDGHDTGIYPFKKLRSLCSCHTCKKQINA